MFAIRLFQRELSSATMVWRLLIVIINVGVTSAFGQVPAAKSGEAVEAMTSRVAGQPALQNALQRVFSNWRRDYFPRQNLALTNGRSLAFHPAAAAGHRQPAIRPLQPLAL